MTTDALAQTFAASTLLAAVVCAFGMPVPEAAAQSDAGIDDGGMKSAGSDARFRVIERFPDEEERSTASGTESRSRPDRLELAVSDELAEAIQRSDWAEAAKIAGRRIGEDRPSHAFIDGYIAWKRERWEAAREAFDESADSWSKLEDYSAYYAAASALEAGEHHDAVVRAARVPTASRLFGDALSVMVRGLLASEATSDRERAGRVASKYLDHFPSGEHAPRMRLELVGLGIDQEGWTDAADRAFELLERHPLSDEAEEVADLLDEHAGEFPDDIRAKIEDRPKSLQLAYLEALYQRHRSEKLIDEATGRVESWTPGGRPRCQAMYWIGRSHTKLRQHDRAGDWYDRILDECAGIPPFERKALYVGGKSDWNAGHKEDALDLFERLWTDYEDHSFADDTMYFAARIHRERDDMQRAMELLGRQVDRYPNGDMAADAHWLRVRAMYRHDNYDRIVSYVDSVEHPRENEPYTRGRLAYFEARALEARGNLERAREGYREVARSHPLRVYALLALNRIADLEGVPEDVGVCEALSDLCEQLPGAGGSSAETSYARSLPDQVRGAQAFRRGAALFRLGIREWARDEFDRLFDQFSGEKRALMALADLLDRAGAHDFAHGLPDRIEGWRGEYPGSGNRRPWTIAYPRAFRSTVETWADKRDLPRSLVWAIVRKESGYNPGIESWANARGLMQLMEDTAESVADRVGYGGLRASDLLQAETNVRLGTAYLEGLADQLARHPALMAAGYNGGMGNVGGWLDERGDLPLDLWLEDIPYGQTRQYAKVVLANDWTYRWLYGDREVPRLDFDINDVGD
jgi:soluble lytic murein transglycosylase